MSPVARPNRGLAALAGESFSLSDAIGGWRGFAESVIPGLVFVIAYVVDGGFKLPVVASVSAVVLLVVLRLIQRTPVTQALSGAVGVGIGAIWAWRAGDASEYFVPGFWINGAYLAGLVLSVVIRWPLIGVVLALLRGAGFEWREDKRAMRILQAATLIFATAFVIRLAVQLPLYAAGNVAALGTAKLVLGVPLLALVLWISWLVARRATLEPIQPDPLPPTK